MTILLRGQGVAIATAAHLLGQAGLPTSLEPSRRPPVPAIMLGESALVLLRDVFNTPELFADRPRIRQRIVRWGDAEPMAMSHTAVVVSEDDLAAALGPHTPMPTTGTASFTVHAARPFPCQSQYRFGERRSESSFAKLSAEAAPATCWIESVTEGWLFLVPDGDGNAWLLAVGGDLQPLLSQSTMIAPLIASLMPLGRAFDTAPRMLDALSGPDWVACGSAALAFDPLCGDGTAQAIREAILASAIAAAVTRGEDAAVLSTHHHSMLLAAMRRHLQLLLPFYGKGGTSTWWQAQFASTLAGYEACTTRLGALPEPRFALIGFDLVRRELVS